MSDEQTIEQQDVEQAETVEASHESPEAPAAEPKPTETVDFWKAKAREQEKRAKANADAATKLKEIEDRDLSELEKAQRAAKEYGDELAALKAQEIIDKAPTSQKDLALVQAHAARALRGGFGGKLCIHPDQVAPVAASLMVIGGALLLYGLDQLGLRAQGLAAGHLHRYRMVGRNQRVQFAFDVVAVQFHAFRQVEIQPAAIGGEVA